MVATPIGNLEDITLRALRVLREADAIAAEDTRHTRKLLARYEIRTRLLAFHAQSGPRGIRDVLDHLRSGRTVAVVSDAGTPAVSDPGAELVAAVAAEGFPVVPVPGASAVIAALSVAGLPPASFVFAGFPPRALGERRRFFVAMAGEARNTVFYESPRRLLVTLRLLHETLGGRRVVLARELTKQFEEVFRGTTGEALARWEQQSPRGEFVVVVAGAPEPERQPTPVPAEAAALGARARELLAQGLSRRDAARQLAAERGIPRARAYEVVLRLPGPR